MSIQELMALKLKRLMPDIPKAKRALRAELRSIESQPIPARAELVSYRNRNKNRLNAAIGTLDKLSQIGPVSYTPTDTMVLCSIILTYRPALLIQNGKFPSPVPPSAGGDVDWNNVLSPHRTDIENVIESVGRIEFSWDNGDEWFLATGFLVAENIMMTCRHVAEFFCDHDDITDQWTFKTYTKKRRIDYCQEKDNDDEREFKIKEIVKVYDNLDMALFKVTKSTKVSWSSSRIDHPEPLVLADTMPNPPNEVYTIGYPNTDPTEPASNLEAVLEGILGVKRLSPGIIKPVPGINPVILYHDSSVTYGNSGSCVVDINTSKVIGLQNKGIYTDNWNEAVALPYLNAATKNDLMQYGIQFA